MKGYTDYPFLEQDYEINQLRFDDGDSNGKAANGTDKNSANGNSNGSVSLVDQVTSSGAAIADKIKKLTVG